MPRTKNKEKKREARQQRRDQRRQIRKARKAKQKEQPQQANANTSQEVLPNTKACKGKTRFWDTQADSSQGGTPAGIRQRRSDGDTRKVKPGLHFGGGRA